ncbi:DUF6099 family protein [Streptomyces sp. TLI_171]|uniref:DUF6099 family protein n=1 Tax=Streptomyces sp. TLI_171 TaxID=1938859 RepID=UPI000C352B93|nr:DUF6099 family protein [Streptomyces sp. TLI_171]RKE19120.1 hypothetical protein BX266_2427 [Streptomyces sp. TLI_171]
MEALRLIKTVRHALAEARATGDILHEAWQSGLLAEAVGARIADHDGEEFATLGQLLGEAGAHTASCLRQPPEPGLGEPPGGFVEWSGPALVERLTELGELEPVLVELGALLDEMRESLVVLACGADTESLYWSCIDGLDAGSECRDLVAELLRQQRNLAGEREGAGPPEENSTAELRGTTPAAVTSAVSGSVSGPVTSAVGSGEASATKAAGVAPGAARREEPRLVVPLGPPVPAVCAQLRAEPSTVPSCPPRAAEERRSESRPARSVVIEASNSCICSSSDFGVAGALPAGVPGVGGSVQGSDMRGPLQLGGAV